MTFKTLEQRYNERVNNLYRGATSKFENGRPSRGRNDDPLNVRRIGQESFGRISRTFGRFLPLARTAQDLTRLSNFLLSTRGVVFLGKQALLQTGNTFEATRLLNPSFVVANTKPDAHVRRHLTPGALFSGLFGKTDTSTSNVRSMGQLQQGTYDKALGTPAGIFGSITSAFTAKKNVGWSTMQGIAPYNMASTWDTSRPELGTGAVDTHIYTIQNKSSYVFKFGGRMQSSWGALYRNLFTYELDNGYLKSNAYNDMPSNQALQSNPDYGFTTKRKDLLGPNVVSTIDIAYDVPKEIIDTQTSAYATINNEKWTGFITAPGRITSGSKTTYIDGGQSRIDFKTAAGKPDKFPYDSFQTEFEDYIAVKFQMGRGTPIQFRAYLKDLQQSISPQYKEFQYIGRTEKFISYSGAQRDISFKLAVLAAHPSELKEVWKRINYLTGLTFPYAISNGIYQPNIMKLTIGKVFIDQPVYITSLSTNFSEVLESWDIDEEVPMAAQIDMKCVIIEKTQKVANSPFYGITENYFKEEFGARKSAGLTPGSAVNEVIG